MVAFFGARLLMRMHGVSPTVSTTLSNSRPRPLVCRSPFVMSSPHDVRALSRPRSQQRTLYPTVRRDAPRRARQGMRIQELHASSASGSSTKSASAPRNCAPRAHRPHGDHTTASSSAQEDRQDQSPPALGTPLVAPVPVTYSPRLRRGTPQEPMPQREAIVASAFAELRLPLQEMMAGRFLFPPAVGSVPNIRCHSNVLKFERRPALAAGCLTIDLW